jgi:acetyl esterase/lipase
MIPSIFMGRIQTESVDENSVKGEWVQTTANPQDTIYYLHGGAYVSCSPATHRQFTAALSRAADARVFSLDYRLAPEHRFPAAVEDAVVGYQWLVSQGIDPQNMVIGGDSAGGGLALATMAALRDMREKLPRAAFLLSPWTDLAVTGESIDANDLLDPMFFADNIRRMAAVYIGDSSPRDPLASPFYANLAGFPPMLIYASDTEVLLDDSRRLADRAKQSGVSVDLRIRSGLPHVWPVFVAFGVPESRKAINEISRFIHGAGDSADDNKALNHKAV